VDAPDGEVLQFKLEVAHPSRQAKAQSGHKGVIAHRAKLE
jgi:hypothetical protein